MSSTNLHADVVFLNGKVYTVDENTDWERYPKEAVAVAGHKIAYVGTNDGAQAYIDADTQTIDLKGKMVLPGFIDSHQHLSQGGVEDYCTLKLFDYFSLEEYQKAIKEYRQKNPHLKSIRGIGWRNGVFPHTVPTKEMLDAAVSDIPMMFISVDHHSIWANTKAIEMAGITKDTPDPAAGVIERDKVTGEPVGVFRELAMDLIDEAIPNFPIEEIKAAILDSQSRSQSYGITTVFDPNIYIGDERTKAYKLLEAEGKLGIRVRGALFYRPADGDRIDELLPIYVKERENNLGSLFQTNTIKLGMDGVVGGFTAYLKEPYEDKGDHRGLRKWENEENLKKVIELFDKEGFQIHVHTIGDGATSFILDMLDYAQTKNGKRDRRPNLAHLQLVDENDIPRMKELGAIAAVSPFWFVKDDLYYNIQVPYLGKKRADREYPMKDFFEAGILAASSSDWPATVVYHPLLGIQTGITRLLPGITDPREILWPEQSVSLKDMITSYTLNGAKANFLETETGSLEVGKKADLIVLEKNLFDIPVESITDVKVLLTMLEGKAVYNCLSW